MLESVGSEPEDKMTMNMERKMNKEDELGRDKKRINRPFFVLSS